MIPFFLSEFSSISSPFGLSSINWEPQQPSTPSRSLQLRVTDLPIEEAIIIWLEQQEDLSLAEDVSDAPAFSERGADEERPESEPEQEVPPNERPGGYHDLGSRIQVLTLMEVGFHYSVVTAFINIKSSR
jgi:hypothetical protein